MAKVAIQGGVKNYLPSNEVTVPKKAKSSKNHPATELAYITKAEKDLLIKKDLHNSLNGKPNKGPGGIISLNGDFGIGESYGDRQTSDTSPEVGDRGGGYQERGDPGYRETINRIRKAAREEEVKRQAREKAASDAKKKETTQRAIEFEKSKKQTKKDRTAKLKRILTSKNKNLINTLGLSARELKDLEVQGLYDPLTGFKNPEDFGLLDSDSTSGLYKLLEKDDNFSGAIQKNFQNTFNPKSFGPTSLLLAPLFKKGALSTRNYFTDKVLNKGRYTYDGQTVTPEMFKMMSPSQMEEVYGSYLDDRQSGKIDAMGNPNLNFGNDGGGRDNNQAYVPPIIPDDTTDDETQFEYRFGNPNDNMALDVTLGRYSNFAANGGIMNAVPRQGYFLGKIVKSAKKFVGGVADAAGKVLKSDLGKAALLYAGGVYLGGGNPFSLGAYNPANFLGKEGYLSNIAGKALLKDPSKGFGVKDNLSLGKILGLSAVLPFIPGINKVPENPDIGMADRGGSLIDPLTGQEAVPAEMRASLNDALDNADGDPAKIKQITDAYAFLIPDQRLGTYLPYETYAANGGRIGYADAGPVDLSKNKVYQKWVQRYETNPDSPLVTMHEKADVFKNFYERNKNSRAEGGIMDLGGMEKDYRAEGGFVPIGREEKADDVPARLSVNEFVFTADAVRNAGGGDIDKGAEVMENMMKNLENGGRVSEESQGNTGAQEMFSVSERIGEVI